MTKKPWKDKTVGGYTVEYIAQDSGPSAGHGWVGVVSYEDPQSGLIRNKCSWSADGAVSYYAWSHRADLVPAEVWVKGCDLKPGMVLNYYNNKPNEDISGFSVPNLVVVSIDMGDGRGVKLYRGTKDGYNFNTISPVSSGYYRIVETK